MSSLGRIIAREEAKRAAISGLILAALAIMISQAIPPGFYPVGALHGTPLLNALRNRTSFFASALGLRQDWNMFAPNPLRENGYVEAEITYSNGQKRLWTFPQMQELGYVERYAKERYRKFANERLWVRENSVLWPDAARFIARVNRDSSNPPRIVKLAHYVSVIPPALPPGEQPPEERWQRTVFFTYTVNPGDVL